MTYRTLECSLDRCMTIADLQGQNLNLKLLVTESRVFEEHMATLSGSATTVAYLLNGRIIIYYAFNNMN